MRLAGCSITRRAPMISGSNLATTDDVGAPPADLEHLVRAYALLDAAGRAELLHCAEQLAKVLE